MDNVFWMGLAIGAIFSLIASIIANIFSEKIQNTLETFKLSRHGKNKAKALKEYVTIRRMHLGHEDKYLYLMRLAFVSSLFFILGASSTIIALILVTSTTLAELLSGPSIIRFAVFFVVAFTFIGLVGILVGFFGIHRFTQISRALSQYPRYEPAMLGKWQFTQLEIAAAEQKVAHDSQQA
jgi:hypothetical protein